MEVSLLLLSTLLDHLTENKLTVILGTFAVLHLLKLLSKRQAVRKAYKYYEPHFVDEEIKAKKPVTLLVQCGSVRAGTPLPCSPTYKLHPSGIHVAL